MIHDFVNLPWPQFAGMATVVTFLFIVLAPRVKLFRRAILKFASDVFTADVVTSVKDLARQTNENLDMLRKDTASALTSVDTRLADHATQHMVDQHNLERERLRWHRELRALAKQVEHRGRREE